MLTFACAAVNGAGNWLLTTRLKGSVCGPIMPVTYNVPMCLCIFLSEDMIEGCLESIRPFWISQELVAWPWCNLVASQRRPYCPSVKSHAPVGLVSWQWDTVDWAYVLCDSRSQITSLWTAILAWGKTRSRREPNLDCRGADRPGWYDALQKGLHKGCGMGRRIVMMKLICSLGHCECDGHTVHKLSQQHLTASWLSPRESDCSWMHCKVSSDWLPSYIKATWLVLEIFKMDGYFLDSPGVSDVRSILFFFAIKPGT
jgi:hypothetical protein